VHSNGPRDTLARLETLVLMAGFDLPVRAIREQLAAALDVIVQMTRLRDGSRRITQITEVENMEGDIISLQDIYTFDWAMGFDDHGRHLGRMKATGVRPKFCEKLADLGIRLPPNIFDKEEFVGQPSLTTGNTESRVEGADDEGPKAPEAGTVGTKFVGEKAG
jgi:pilus assembly protein CpaF